MDPLSLSVSIITLLGAGGNISRGLNRVLQLKRAPETLLQLNNEVADLQILVRAVDEIYRQEGTSINTTQEEVVRKSLERARIAILELEKLIAYVLTKESDEGPIVDRMAWACAHGKIKRTKDMLRTARNDLNSVWGSINHRAMSNCIHLELHGVSLATERLESALSENQNQVKLISDTTFRQGRALQYLLELANRRIDHIPFSLTSDTSKGDTRTSPLTLNTHSQEDQMAVHRNTYGTISNTDLKDENYSCRRSATNHAESVVSADVLQFHLQGYRGCVHPCYCSCHTQRQFQSPNFFNRIFGSLFIGYVGFPRLRCISHNRKEENCERCRGTTIHIRYAFPNWILQRSVYISMNMSQQRGPELLLRCLRVCSDQSPFFRAVFLGDLDRVRTLLRQREGSALDVNKYGLSPLHATIVARPNSAMIRLLLSEGLDLFQEDHFTMTPYGRAMQKYLGTQDHSTKNWDWFELIDRRDPREELGFSKLHMAVVRLDTTIDINSQIALTPRHDIDERDNTGRTALSWAAQRGDITTIKKLLSKGADPNSADKAGRSPFHYCATNVECITALLDAGADVDSITFGGFAKISRVVMESDSVSCVEVLARFGSDLNRASEGGVTALHKAIEHNRPNILKWLLQRGVDINVCNEYGQTPLHQAIVFRWPEALTMLLTKSADYQIETQYREGLLHYTARFADLETLAILQHANLNGLDVDAKNSGGFNFCVEKGDGKTATEIAKWRRECNSEWSTIHTQPMDQDPEAWFTAFQSFVDSVKATEMVERFGNFWDSLEAASAKYEPTTRKWGEKRRTKAANWESGEKYTWPRPPGSYPIK